jgi:geranylgeranyl diphosphate synthase type II
MKPLDEFLRECRTEVDAALLRYLSSSSQTPPVLAESMRYSVLAGGKRLRPILTLAAADAVGGDHARSLAMPAACAIEMIHTYSLIHDDLPAMDDDSLRRGRPTLHVVSGDGMAILAGDGLQAQAFTLLAREPAGDDPEIARRKLRAIASVAEAAGPEGMVGGQAIDLDAVRPGPDRRPRSIDVEDLRLMHEMKTGRMIRAAAAIGAIMGGASDRLVDAIDGFAKQIGLAFQIVDDILDVESSSTTLGKTAGKDAAAGKPTYPALFGLEQSRQLAAECLARGQDQLRRVSLHQSHLAGIARWVVDRRS